MGDEAKSRNGATANKVSSFSRESIGHKACRALPQISAPVTVS